MPTARWTLSDSSTSYEFQINPNDADSMVPSRDIKWDYNRVSGFSGTRAPRAPVSWSFSGVLREQQQFDDMLLWLNRRVRLTLTTDLGQTMTLRLTSFKPSQTSGGPSRLPYRMTYTMTALIYPPDFYIPKGGLDLPPAPVLPTPQNVVARQGIIPLQFLVNWDLVPGATEYVNVCVETGETRHWLGTGGAFNVPSVGNYTTYVYARNAFMASAPSPTVPVAVTF